MRENNLLLKKINLDNLILLYLVVYNIENVVTQLNDF